MNNRRKHDNYPTPAHQVNALVSPLVDLLGGSLRGTVIEPCAGDEGNIARALVDFGKDLTVVRSDIQPQCGIQCDATLSAEWDRLIDECQFISGCGNTVYRWGRFDWTITNPPFNLALPILENAWEFSRVGVAMLLPITWNEPTKDGTRASKKRGTPAIPPRAPWLVEHADNLRYIMPVSPRPHFRKGEINTETGKEYRENSTTVQWYVWRKDWSWAEMGIQSPFQYLAGWR